MKTIYFLMIAFCAVLLSSCGNDDKEDEDEPYSITISNIQGEGAGAIKTIKACSGFELSNLKPFAAGTLSNGTCKIVLPNNPSDEHLMQFPIAAGINISNPDLRLCMVAFATYDANDKIMGSLTYGKWHNQFPTAMTYTYANSDCTISGTIQETVYDVKLSKGWNMIYQYPKEEQYIISSTAPANTDLKWQFSAYNPD